MLPASRFARYLLVCLLLCAVVITLAWSAIGRHDRAIAEHRTALEACLAPTGEPAVTQGSPCSDDEQLLALAQAVNEADEEASHWVALSSIALVILLALLAAAGAVYLVRMRQRPE